MKSGSTPAERRLSRGLRCPTAIRAGRCGSASASTSCPITKASETSTRARRTAATFAVTRTRASTTCAFRRPTDSASSTAPAAEIELLRRCERHGAQRVAIETHSAAPQTARRFESASESLEHFAPRPDGTHLAFVARGQAFTMPLFEGAVIRHGAAAARATASREWLHDGERLVCVTDVNGYEQIAVHRADASQANRELVTAATSGASPTWSLAGRRQS